MAWRPDGESFYFSVIADVFLSCADLYAGYPFLFYICGKVKMRMRRALLFWVFILVTTPVLQAQQPAERSSSRVTIAGETFYVHTVKPGETFYSLGKLYDTDEETIRPVTRS